MILLGCVSGTKKKLLAAPGEITNDADHPPIPVEQFGKHVTKMHKSDDRGFMIEYNASIVSFPFLPPSKSCPYAFSPLPSSHFLHLFSLLHPPPSSFFNPLPFFLCPLKLWWSFCYYFCRNWTVVKSMPVMPRCYQKTRQRTDMATLLLVR